MTDCQSKVVAVKPVCSTGPTLKKPTAAVSPVINLTQEKVADSGTALNSSMNSNMNSTTVSVGEVSAAASTNQSQPLQQVTGVL